MDAAEGAAAEDNAAEDAAEDAAEEAAAEEDAAEEDAAKEDNVENAAAAGLEGIKKDIMMGCDEASRLSASLWLTFRQATPLPC